MQRARSKVSLTGLRERFKLIGILDEGWLQVEFVENL